jgi:CxxC-x17-CxxC domain-containing protein
MRRFALRTPGPTHPRLSRCGTISKTGSPRTACSADRDGTLTRRSPRQRRSVHLRYRRPMPVDSMLTCRDCGQTFVFTVPEQEYCASRGFDNPPGRCPNCRAARKAERGGEHRSSTSRGPRQMLSTACASCGKEAQLPFQPSGDRPVYCSECYQDHRGSPSGSRSRGRGRY